MLKTKHLLHPLRTAAAAKSLLSIHLNATKFARAGDLRYRNDDRYELQVVRGGFTSLVDDQKDDTEILERICTAYTKAVQQDSISHHPYRPTEWWELVRRNSLGPVMQALATRNIPAVRAIYRNFFRNACSDGLVGKPLILSETPFIQRFLDVHRRYFLSDALHRLDYWMEQTGSQFALSDLGAPRTGDPFGVLLQGTLLRTGAEYQHYCAQKIRGLLPENTATMVEIGGGFGGMAYYLLRDCAEVTYLDFDLPESIALAAYYLMKTLPELRFLLYGEDDLTEENLHQYNAVLMPASELPKLSSGSVDLTFSSHTISDSSDAAKIEYLYQIARITRGYFLYEGVHAQGRPMIDFIRKHYPLWLVMERNRPRWYIHKQSATEEEELLYHLGDIWSQPSAKPGRQVAAEDVL